MNNSKLNDLDAWLNGAGRSIAEFMDRVDVWWQKPETQAAVAILLALPAEAEARADNQRKFLKKGILPAKPLLALKEDLSELAPGQVAAAYADALEAKGYSNDAARMRELGQVADLGFHDLTLRAIYPGIEAVTRQHVYEAGSNEGMASLLEMRTFIAGIFTEGLSAQTAEIMSSEPFMFLHLAAIDVAYARTKAKRRPRNRLIFGSVANRHLVCHGLVSGLQKQHAINGLTLLYSANIIGQFMLSQGLRVPQGKSDIAALLADRMDMRRGLNRETLTLLRALPKVAIPTR